ncbi:hypothetical protein [Comamonas sp. wu1-DMT]|uniref:hypothetical protein n=1 Tax=Comamonas sp. wu1-DMT TaxID=3126390 RepID=UPI0032E3F63A
MSDWDFLHDMHNEGYSADEIADAAALGYAPWQAKHISFGAQSKKNVYREKSCRSRNFISDRKSD